MSTVGWQRVEVALFTAKGIAWDGCHKIYVLMDDDQVREMRDLGYDPVLPVVDAGKALETVREWWGDSCTLRFVSAVKTVQGNPNEGFLDLIAQFEGGGVEVAVGTSAGADGAVVVNIATEFEPDGSDHGPGLRVLINDDEAYVGKPYEFVSEEE